MFWKNWSWPERILSVVGLGVVGAILFPVFIRPRGGDWEGRSSCQSNLRQIGLAFLQYTQDYNEKFPLVTTGHSAYGWADAIQPYLKSTQIYQCPYEPTSGQTNPRKSGYTDYPFDARMSGKSLEKLEDPNAQILSLDGNYKGDVTDARYALAQIPSSWRQNQNSPLYRHLNWASYLFADGHVRSLPPERLEGTNHPVF